MSGWYDDGSEEQHQMAQAARLATAPRCIPHCPVCDKAAPPMPLTDYLRNGGPICCGVKTRLAA